MTSIVKPVIPLVALPKNDLGLTIRDYEGAVSTLCAGCGHDSVTAAITHTFWELSMPPHTIAKLSGIGCSSKTPTYFVRGAHGFNSAHGRMVTIATGANAANRELNYIGISGDGDSLSIGLGHLAHAIRRNVNMVYIIENNGVYGLTKGQFSASADIGSRLKKGEPNAIAPIDPILLGLSMGATFLARSFSGDKAQLVPILKAAAAHNGLALIDVISPCVTFNDHEGSTKSYKFMKDHEEPLHDINFVPVFDEIDVEYEPGSGVDVTLHDGSRMHLSKLEEDYDPTSRIGALTRLAQAREKEEVLTGLFYLNSSAPSFTDLLGLGDTALVHQPESVTRPGKAVLDAIMEEYR